MWGDGSFLYIPTRYVFFFHQFHERYEGYQLPEKYVSYLNSHLGYSAGEFQALQLIVLAVFGAVD